MCASVPIAEGKSKFSALVGAMAPGQRYVLTEYAEAEATRKHGGDREKMEAAADQLLDGQKRETAAKKKEKALRTALGGLSWDRMWLLKTGFAHRVHVFRMNDYVRNGSAGADLVQRATPSPRPAPLSSRSSHSCGCATTARRRAPTSPRCCPTSYPGAA